MQDDAQQETWQFTQLTGWLTSDGDWLTDADMLENHPAEREAALLNQRLAATPYGVPSSRLLPETFLGNPVYVQYLGFFMNQSTWFADRYGNRIEVPGVGERFWLVDLYYDAGGSLMGYFVTVEDPDIQWSYPGTTVFYNLTTGEQLEQPDEGAAPLGAESVIFCAAGDRHLCRAEPGWRPDGPWRRRGAGAAGPARRGLGADGFLPGPGGCLEPGASADGVLHALREPGCLRPVGWLTKPQDLHTKKEHAWACSFFLCQPGRQRLGTGAPGKPSGSQAAGRSVPLRQWGGRG